MAIPPVLPGDLITAALMNQVLTRVMDIQTRVARLESKPAVPDPLVLHRPLDGAQFRVGDDLLIEGRNLGVTRGKSLVTVDGGRATEYRPGGTDERVTVVIPGVSIPTADGRDVQLVVSNGTSAATRTLRIRPKQDLMGAIGVTWTGVTPNPIQPGRIATFDFVLKSHANLDAQYLITPKISRVEGEAAWNAATSVLLEGVPVPSRMIPVASGAERTIQVQIAPVPGVAAETAFSLTVSAVSGAVAGTTGRLPLRVGSLITLPDPDLTLSIATADFFPAGTGALTHDDESDVLRVNRMALATLTLMVRIKVAGKYELRIRPISSPGVPTTDWSLVRHPEEPAGPDAATILYDLTQAEIDAAGPEGEPIAPVFNVTPLQMASDVGEAQITVERRDSGKSRSRLIRLVAS